MTTSTVRKVSTKQDSDGHDESSHHGVRHMPVHVPVPVVRMPGGTAGHVLWWGGLATVAVFGVVDWPVVALVAAGSWVAEQYAKAAQRPDGNRDAD